MTNTTVPASGRFAEGQFRIGHVLSQSWAVFSRNFLRFTVIAAIGLLPSLLTQQSGFSSVFLNVRVGTAPGNAGPNVGIGLVMIVLYLLSQAILLHAAFQDMSGRPIKLNESVSVALRRFFPIIGVGLAEVIAFGLYGVLLILLIVALAQALQSGGLAALATFIGFIPLVMIYLMWSVAIPACVVERLGPFRSLGRSRQLTQGHRWKIFGMLILILVMLLISGVVVGFMIGFVAGVGNAFSAGAGSLSLGLIGRVIGLVVNAIVTAFFTILVAVTYHDLRVAKEGNATDQIAAVFD
jgi:hypothetical protein